MQLSNANDDISLGRRHEKELIERIDQLKVCRHDSLSCLLSLYMPNHFSSFKWEKEKLKTANDRLEKKSEASTAQIKVLKDKVELQRIQKADLMQRYNELCEEYKKATDLLEPIVRKMTPSKREKYAAKA